MMEFMLWFLSALGQFIAFVGTSLIVPGVTLASFVIGAFVINLLVTHLVRVAGVGGSGMTPSRDEAKQGKPGYHEKVKGKVHFND